MSKTHAHDASFHISLPTMRRAAAGTTSPRELARPGPRFSRTDRAVLMHVFLLQDGREVRHRIMIDENVHSSWTYSAIMNGKTACEKTIAAMYYRVTQAGIAGELCREGCFTAPELRNADRLRANAEEAAHADAERESAERARSFAEIRERNARARTGETEPVAKVDVDDKFDPDKG